MRTATLGLLLLVVTACASTDTSRPDTSRKQPEPEMVWEMPPNGSPTQFNRDIYECKRENMQAGEY